MFRMTEENLSRLGVLKFDPARNRKRPDPSVTVNGPNREAVSLACRPQVLQVAGHRHLHGRDNPDLLPDFRARSGFNRVRTKEDFVEGDEPEVEVGRGLAGDVPRE